MPKYAKDRLIMSPSYARALFWMLIKRVNHTVFEELAGKPFQAYKEFQDEYERVDRRIIQLIGATSFGVRTAGKNDGGLKGLLHTYTDAEGKEHIVQLPDLNRDEEPDFQMIGLGSDKETQDLFPELIPLFKHRRVVELMGPDRYQEKVDRVSKLVSEWLERWNLDTDWCRKEAFNTMHFWRENPDWLEQHQPIADLRTEEPITGRKVKVDPVPEKSDKLKQAFFKNLPLPEELKLAYSNGWNAHLGEKWMDARDRIIDDFQKKLSVYRRKIEKLMKSYDHFQSIDFAWLILRVLPPQLTYDQLVSRTGAPRPEKGTINRHVHALARFIGLETQIQKEPNRP
ncbi:MAG: hypothetical protein C4523_14060 [Myxococcales bacterium]|nr:MAG: hypothetical protein C4523_14060 [Myxococcales bacterium]